MFVLNMKCSKCLKSTISEGGIIEYKETKYKNWEII